MFGKKKNGNLILIIIKFDDNNNKLDLCQENIYIDEN